MNPPCPYGNCHHNHPELQDKTAEEPGAMNITPRNRRRTAAFHLALAGAYVSAAVFAFCVVASVAYHWHQAATKPGLAVSVVVLVACAVVLNLTAGDE